MNQKDNKTTEEKDFNPKEGLSPAERFIKGFDYAFEGIVFSIKSEKNMKFHVILSMFVLLFSLFLNVTRIEMILIIFSISFVFIVELINTAIEQLVNLACNNKYSKLAKIAKDVSAGACLVAALCAIFVAYLIFFDKAVNFTNSVFSKIQRKPEHIAVITLVIVVILTVLLKGIFYKGYGSAFHGGAVSGHTAVAFSLATIVMIMSKDFKVSVISYMIAAIVAESRFEANIHSVREIISGLFLGILVTLLIFGGLMWLM